MERHIFINGFKWEIIISAIIIVCIGLSNCEKNGAPPKPELLPATVSFSVNIQPMLTTYCAISGCHSGTQPPARLDLSVPDSYSNLLAQNMVNISNPSESRLYTCLFAPMPPWG